MSRTAASAATRSGRWPAFATYGAMALLLAAALLVARSQLGLAVPLGPDPAMWGLAASSIGAGELPQVAPGYPALTWLLAVLTGSAPWQAGALVSLACVAAVPVLVFALAVDLGTDRWTAAFAAGGAALLPDLVQFAFQLQPDALATALVLGVFAAGAWWERAGSRAAAVSWVGCALALALVREHGVLILGAIPIALVARRSRRAAVAAVALLGCGAALVLVLGMDLLPDRLAMPLRESPLAAGHGPAPDYAKELLGAGGEALRAAWARGDRLTVWASVLDRAVARSGLNLALIGLGLVGFALAQRRVPWAALVALSPAILTLLIWTQRRHTSVLVPVALVGIALGVSALARWRPVALVAALPLLLFARELPSTLDGLTRAAAAGHDRVALASWMRSQPGSWFLGGQHNEINLHLLWPRHNPPLPPPGQPMPSEWSGTDWRTLWVAPVGAMPPPFTPVHHQGGLAVFRLEAAPGASRPCSDVSALPGTLFAAEPVQGRSEPPCSAAPWFGERPDPTQQGWQGQPWVPAEGR